MRYGSRKLYVTHTLTSYLVACYFNAATLTYFTFETDSLIFTAGTLPVLCRTKYLFAVQTASFGLLCSVVDCFGTLNNAVAPCTDLIRRSKTDLH